MSNQIIPDPEDFQAIESEHGALPPDATDVSEGSSPTGDGVDPPDLGPASMRLSIIIET
jgi:hypothetical protein